MNQRLFIPFGSFRTKHDARRTQGELPFATQVVQVNERYALRRVA